jgi:hypothetical protein
MKSLLPFFLAVLMIPTFISKSSAEPTYIGYSGAPGSSGRCAGSCHGGSGGTIVASGFPTEYTPGQVYTISVTHNGGSMIKQFNSSCRVGTGSQNAGVLAASTNTATYNTSGETNGVHTTALDIMNATFTWTAPSAGTGSVTLYLAGHQGAYSGANTVLTFTATEQVSGIRVGDPAVGSEPSLVHGSSPNPFRDETVIGFVLPRAGSVLVEIYDSAGRRLEARRSEETAGLHQITWNASAYPSGTYFYTIRFGSTSDTGKLTVVK